MRTTGRRTAGRARRMAAVALAVTAASAATSVAAGAAGPSTGGRIGPHQVFGGTVNGSTGVGGAVVIQMACFGPLRPGETGHPLKGQTVSVFPGEDPAPFLGNTGTSGRQIDAFFGPPPPAASASGGPVVFHRYQTKPIPTSEVLPCAGSGQVTFVPLPQSPASSKDAVVPVTYAGQP